MLSEITAVTRFLLPALMTVLFGLSASANVLGTMQTFQPTPDLTEFETVHSSKTMKAGRFNVGGFMAYQKNQLTVFNSLLTNPTYVAYKDAGWQYDVVGAYAWTNNLTLTLANTGMLNQTIEKDQIVDGVISNLYITNGSHSFRPGAKYSFREDPNGWAAAVIGSIDFPMTSEDPYQGNPSNQNLNVEAAMDWFDQTTGYGFNVGYRARKPGSVSNTGKMYPLKNQLTFSAAAAWGLDSDLRWHAELFGAMPMSSNDYKESNYERSLEALLGLRYQMWKHIWLHGGGTVEAIAKGLSPDWRAYAGVNWYFGDTRKKKPTPKPDPVVEEQVVDSRPLESDPASVEVFNGSQQQIVVSGGVQPYRYDTGGFGRYNETTQYYQAPYQSGSTELIVIDANGSELRVPIVVKEIPKANKTFDLRSLNFVFNSAELTPSAKPWLQKNLEQLRGEKIKSLVLIGHTDNVGDDDYNLQLSRERAETVRREMLQYLGLGEDQIQAVGAGETQPIASNDTDEGRARNRRVEIRVYFDK